MQKSNPNLYISLASRKHQNIVHMCELGIQMVVQKNGWIGKSIFCEWLDYFKDLVPKGVLLEKKTSSSS